MAKARERLDSLSALRSSTSPAETSKTEESKTPTKVAVPGKKRSKVLQLRQKPPQDLAGTTNKDSESVLIRVFGSKVLLSVGVLTIK